MPKITHCTITFSRDLQYGEASALYILAENTLGMTPVVKPKGQNIFRQGKIIAYYAASISFPKMIRDQEDVDYFCQEIIGFAKKYEISLSGRMDIEDASTDETKTGRKLSYRFNGTTASKVRR